MDFFPNCLRHRFDQSTQDSYYCSGCEDGYVLNGRTCQAITLSNCLQGNLDSSGTETCTKCEDGYYRNDGNLSCNANPTNDTTVGYDENCSLYEKLGLNL